MVELDIRECVFCKKLFTMPMGGVPSSYGNVCTGCKTRALEDTDSSHELIPDPYNDGAAFDEGWQELEKQGGWANAFRQWAKENMNMEWFDSEYGIGSEEDPVMGFNYDEWDFQIRQVAHQALREELKESFSDDDVDHICDSVSEPSWDRATNDQTNPMEGVEVAIQLIQKWIELFRWGGTMEL